MIAVLTLALLTAQVPSQRYAVLLGANVGDADEVSLRFAESDAERMGKILSDFGGFPENNITVLRNAQAGDARRTLAEMSGRIRRTGGSSLLVFFYSGHADAESLHLSGTRLPLADIKELVGESGASARVMVIDACRSGALTRVKGGTPGPSFAVHFEDRLAAEGTAIVTSSAAGENSQESDQLGASFFTHFFSSALMGAGDSNEDGRVTLSEAFSYASERTLVATNATVAGPQHPTYHVDMAGRRELVLTEPKPSGRFGGLVLSGPGSYLVHRETTEGPLVAEVVSAEGQRTLAVPSGRYVVTRRFPDHLRRAPYAVSEGSTVRVEAEAMEKIALTADLRKGGANRYGKRSINGTAETLPAGEFEVAFVSLAVGLTDHWQLTAPTIPWALGGVSLDTRYRFELSEGLTLTPFVDGEYSFLSKAAYGSAGTRLGMAVGERRQHAFTIGGGVSYSVPDFDQLLHLYGLQKEDPKAKLFYYLLLEYDYYTAGGNFFYVGIYEFIPYLGFTWTWKNVHFGIVSSLASVFIPLPYVYFRF